MNAYMNLQLFADAGTLVNTSVNYANAYDANSKTEFSGVNTLLPTLKTYYDTELLENARCKMVFSQFGKKQYLPKGRGKTVEWRKWNTFPRASKLQEGVIPTGQKFGMTYKTASIDQYGAYAAISDRLEMRAYDDVILGATEEMGASASETMEYLIRDALLTGNIKADGTKVGTPTSCATMGAGGTTASGGNTVEDGWALLTPDMVNKAVTKMKKDKVPTLAGNKYVAVIHPSVSYDLRSSKDWVEAHKYAATTELFNGEIGELHGCRFIENPDAPVLGGDGYKNKSNGVTYATYFLGKDAFGVIDPEGGGLEMIIKNKGEVGGPLEQFSTVGYKLETNGATLLYPERVLRVMSVSSYSATDAAN